MFEAEQRIGGHTATVDVSLDGERHAIDTGFIVFNDRTYPNFIRLLDAARRGLAADRDELQRAQRARAASNTTAATSTACSRSAATCCARRFWRMLRDILRFNRERRADLQRRPHRAEA